MKIKLFFFIHRSFLVIVFRVFSVLYYSPTTTTTQANIMIIIIPCLNVFSGRIKLWEGMFLRSTMCGENELERKKVLFLYEYYYFVLACILLLIFMLNYYAATFFVKSFFHYIEHKCWRVRVWRQRVEHKHVYMTLNKLTMRIK
jgi:hypothetical protein